MQSINSTPITPVTLLEAINVLLTSVRISQVNSLQQIDINEDAAAAKQALDTVSREVQEEGWEFNTEGDVNLLPNHNGQIVLPFNTIRASTARTHSGDRVVVRGGKLYNNSKRTYVFPSGVRVDLVVALTFEELPPVVRTYVVALAARRFGIPKLPEGSTFRFTEELVQQARLRMEHDDDQMSETDLKMTNPHFGGWGRR